MESYNLSSLSHFAQTHNTGGGIWGLDSDSVDTQEAFLSEILDFSRVWVYHSRVISENVIELALGIYEYNSDRWRRIDIRCKTNSWYPRVWMAIDRDYNYALDIYMPSKGSPFDDYWGAVLLTVGKSPREVHCYIECSEVEIIEPKEIVDDDNSFG